MGSSRGAFFPLLPWTIAAILLAGCLAPEGTGTEPPSNPGTGSTTATSAGPGTAGPYTDLLDSSIRGLTPQEVADIAAGAGMRLALPAELNGHPGPKHILELQADLNLTREQEQRVQALYDRTMEEARREGEELLRLWRVLDDGFRHAAWDDASLKDAVTALDHQNGILRYVHLRAHLEARAILDADQRAMYDQLRGYAGGGDHAHDDAGGGHAHGDAGHGDNANAGNGADQGDPQGAGGHDH